MEQNMSLKLPLYTEQTFADLKKESIRLYAYTNRFTSQIMPYCSHREITFALFSPRGCLLKLYGPTDVLQNMKIRHGICRMSDWRAQSIGYNAVWAGLTQNRTLSSVGEDNTSPALHPYAVYFSPCSMTTDPEQTNLQVVGGMAIIVPFYLADDSFLMFAAAAANDIMLHLFMAESLNNATESEEGFITIDINAKNESKHLIYHNANIYRVLGIENQDLYFQRADSLFDPLPQNQEFWDIIDNRKRIHNHYMPISIRGRYDQYKLTALPYEQTDLAISGINLYIRSKHSVTSEISNAIGNNALMKFDDVVGRAPSFTKVVQQAKRIATTGNDVLIIGETGTGKDIFAQCIHNASARNERPFIILNCAAYPEELLYHLLFGISDGRQISSSSISDLELADGGTILLNDVDALSPGLQSMLRQYIENRTLKQKGISSLPQIPDVRIIAASSTDLLQLVYDRKFRPDLYYHLNGLHIRIPPLRERPGDIPLIADHLVSIMNSHYLKNPAISISPEARQMLSRLPWNGNVRELKNAITGIIQVVPDLEIIKPENIIEYMGSSGTLPREYNSYQRYLKPGTQQLTREIVIDALNACNGNKKKTAEKLEISRRTLYRYLERFKIND